MPKFPRGVPVLHTHPEANELGFTLPQIVAMQSGFTILMPSFELHGRRVAVTLFERHPHYLELFRQLPPDNQSAHAFCPKIMQFMLQLAIQGLDDPDMYRKLVADFVRYTMALGLMSQDIVSLLGPVREHIMNELEVQMSETLQDAIDIFFTNIVVEFEKETKRQRTTMLLL